MPNAKRRCLYCKEYKARESGRITPIGFFCNIDHAAWHARNKQNAANERIVKRANAKAKEKKRKFKKNDVNYQHDLTQPVFNKMRRLEELEWFKIRNLEPTCMSCGKMIGNDIWSCGHMKSVGAHSELRYDRKNSFLQHNMRCNRYLSGDIEGTKTTSGYKRGLILRFGAIEGQAIIDYCERYHPPIKYTGEQLIARRKQYNARIRELTNE